MAGAPDDHCFAELLAKFRYPTSWPDPALNFLVLERPSMTPADRDSWVTGVRALQMAGLVAFAAPLNCSH